MRGSFSSSCETPETARSRLLSHSRPVLGFDSVRFLLLYPGERQGGLSSRPYCAGVNYVRINAES